MPDNLCRQFAQILNSNIMDSKDGSCSVIRLRDNLKINILGRYIDFLLYFKIKV
ncbi:hypothetical protein CLAUR_043430 [Clostridium felsineum]|nr:hypothetical protein CLAUR_043430 [Clostridium felsineum]